MRKKSPLKAHEIITVYPLGNNDNLFMKKHIVIARTTSRAIDILPLEDGEKILQAKELLEYHVIVEGKK